MKNILLFTLLTLTLLEAKINVVSTYPYLGAVAEAIGGENIHTTVLGEAKYDPHFVLPKPSLIRKVNRADLLIINGSGLEIGWLPPLLKSANNRKINPGNIGFADASQVIKMIDQQASVSRAYGDVHPEGNPHYNTDPHNIIPVAMFIAHKLERIDPIHKEQYATNLKKFLAKWKVFLEYFDKKMLACHGKKVIQYHELYNYLLKRYGIESLNTIEPLPGIAPSSKHTVELISLIKAQKIQTILQDTYHETKTAKFIGAKTGADVIVLPHDLGATKKSDTLKLFYTQIAERLCH